LISKELNLFGKAVSKDFVKVRGKSKWDLLLNQLIIKVELKDVLLPRNVHLPRNVDLLPRNVDLLPRNVDLLPRNVDLLPRNVDLLPRNVQLPRNADLLPRKDDQLEDVVQLIKLLKVHQMLFH
jgi:hypothetical protein